MLAKLHVAISGSDPGHSKPVRRAGGESSNGCTDERQASMAATGSEKKRQMGIAVFAALAVLLIGAISASAAYGNLKETCAEDILKQPTVNSPNGVPGTGLYDAGTKDQRFDVGMNFETVDPSCKGHFKRLPYFMPQLVRHGRKINESPYWLQLFTPGYDPNVGGNFGSSYFTSLTAPKYEYWRRGDKARFRLRITDLNLATKKVVAKSVTTHAMQIVTHK
jgi:hypothetical protein